MTAEKLLPGIHCPEDLRRLPREALPQVAAELREEIVERVSRTGGHLASSLGAVELITGIHAVFDTPEDRLVLDVGHQGYPHKMLTGRREDFGRIGKPDGIAKFLRRAESPYDHFGAGHAGTSISAALGMARAMQHMGSDRAAIALIGDGGMTAGMAFEALNHAGDLKQKNLVVVLNDNEMSISPNVGALSSYLSRKLSNPMARRLKGWAKEFLDTLPGDMVQWAQKAEESLKVFFSPGLLFEALGFRYVGPIQGHRLEVVLETFENVRQMIRNGDGPVLVHALTAKGHGYEAAEQDPVKYHGVGVFDPVSGEFAPRRPGPPKYQDVFAETLIRLARDDERIVAITAAMADGTGLSRFAEVFPERFYDVGIAEQHAVTFAAGLACEGMKPVPAIYSTFLQRAFDQVAHDVCLQNLDVTFAIDRAGIVGADGSTHQGFYDVAYLRALPNMVVMAPKDENELQHMLRTAVEHRGPAALRFPRGGGFGVPLDPEIKAVPLGEAELLRDGDDAAILALGTLVHPAVEAAVELGGDGLRVAVLNARFAKPLDAERILDLARRCGVLLTVEEHSVQGGFGAAVLELLAASGVSVPVRCLAIPDAVVEHGDPGTQKAAFGFDPEGIATAVRQLLAR
ncbi:MAG: 1-deoxy-D-xylulose-5-phosphate synthase [Myxococcota bacterium]|jgi:1-deoxy-D-xylulose-5-phosphate synthase|nr:1-deoxy-D-xylulose-5-phosphate synthase [Deltaproteobacteria bacterium]MCP4240411.1 1-deoxy-D-xylulose-5-phosphate synthase [bacterium]MDP6074775.1 1-deoxy-D-xylulose-5-phosphate synthase [Myxococcota bacterium]MDP7076314.1 1-deoxy-D-xylulose-5-phosphate synthase [Myxococcota bacterium]MDP7300014.1 1-deoxy-D-xylulose-5-phosphate synthase [Myxococcota bacterium]